MDTTFAERCGKELVNERKMIASLMEAAVHGRTVVFLCPTHNSAMVNRRRLAEKAKSLKNKYADPTLMTKDEVYFRSGGCVKFLINNKNNHALDGMTASEVMWI